MKPQLRVSLGQYSDKGRKPVNQDCHGCHQPAQPQLHLKGVALAMADGISSSEVSHIASETAVRSVLDDYFCTSEAWSVRHSVNRVLTATNAWLYSQTCGSPYRYDRDRGYACTLSVLVLKASTAYLFHAGDTRIYRLRDQALEQLTHDHRLWVSREKSYLSRALGVDAMVEFDHRALPLQVEDLFMLATDGVYEHVDAAAILATIDRFADDLDQAARSIVQQAYDNGSGDNLSLQLVRVDELSRSSGQDLAREIEDLPLPPVLGAGAEFDGYRIERELHANSRSHVYLATDPDSGERVILKTPSIDLGEDPAYLERFLLEEWIARRVNNPHVMAAGPRKRPRGYLYTVTEYIEGQTLAQWLRDNPAPDIETVRQMVEQIARGLYALHRMDILHQDLRPENVMIEAGGTVKLIDFGAARVAGLVEAEAPDQSNPLPGTALYMAPEYFLGEPGTEGSDLYSLAVRTYHMLSGRFPYGTQVAKARTLAAQRRLNYRSVLHEEREIPAWIDETLKQALHPNPERRTRELSEFIYDLRHPNQAYRNRTRPPLMERNPVAFWQGVSALLAVAVVVLLTR
ncbi:MAG: bifunctional protein-serine/threonine kinase/phosphatase [Marinobacter sp.]|uniref:bifunctional protein-serine/threonine kinase/phosphatase n=1 Tax=Marinobacter sp. TaxID=50741 RepID=UPI00299EBD49|nr:bifunctional protein-serine/threonine kinase/phosphatase [Marinobacter sp.]MDX1635872.1 bifunctional protein-serine/threonine kinase/phosphatase [Marinobacter sp.]